MLRPIYLQPGDKVALISPSGIATKEQLDYGSGLMEFLKQPLYHPLSLHEKVITLCAATHKVMLGSWNPYPDNTFSPDTEDWQARTKNDYMICKQPLTPRTSGPSGAWREITVCYVSCRKQITPYSKETPNG